MTSAGAELSEKMRAQMLSIVSINRQPTEAYQIVCDEFYDYINEIKTQKLETPEWLEVLKTLQEGINDCPCWVSTGQCMRYFLQLKQVVDKTLKD